MAVEWRQDCGERDRTVGFGDEGKGINELVNLRQRLDRVVTAGRQRDGWKASASRLEHEPAGSIVAGLFAQRAVGAQERYVDDAGKDRQPPIAFTREIGFRDLDRRVGDDESLLALVVFPKPRRPGHELDHVVPVELNQSPAEHVAVMGGF